MKVSLKWVNEFVDISDLNPNDIAEKLTLAGIEVEAVNKMAVGDRLVTGLVKKCQLIEGSDHLFLTEVDLGSVHGVKQIVCGANNVAVNQKVIVAMVGAKLASITIKQAKIRGYVSDGMIISLPELGIEESLLTKEQIEGIEVLSEDTPIGNENVLKLLNLDDTILELKLLPNRPDCHGLFNVAKEIAMLYNRPIKSWHVKPPVKLPPSKFKITTDKNICPQFSIKVIEGVSQSETPTIIKKRLEAMGMRSVNFLVDIGNYVMLLTGQPLHFYDLDKLNSPQLDVHDQYKGKWTALDEKQYQIQKGDIAITNNEELMCLGGVLGSLAAEVDNTTKNIAIEAAYFDGPTIRGTVNRLNVPSQSSLRFIKGINPVQYNQVLDYTVQLIDNYYGFAQQYQTVSVDYHDYKPTIITFSSNKINEILGTNIDEIDIITTLQRLDIKIEKKANKLIAVIPDSRIDIEGVADLAEEVIRIKGYQHIKTELPKLLNDGPGFKEFQLRREKIRQYLQGRGLDECLTYTLVNAHEAKQMRLLNDDSLIKVTNPMTEEHEYVRGGLVYSLLLSALYNFNHQNKNVALYEISQIETEKNVATHLAIVMSNSRSLQGLLKTQPVGYYDVKGLFEGIMVSLGIEPSRYKLQPFVDETAMFHPYKTTLVTLEHQKFAVFGELDEEVVERLGFKNSKVAVLEMNLSLILNLPISQTTFSNISKFPSVVRDLAMVIDQQINSDQIINSIRRVSKQHIADVSVFDTYSGHQIPENKKSLAIKITFNDENKTLTEQDINYFIQKIKEELNRKFEIQYRV
jgi:phenylalanyl-tRNA synthetase beta chain